MTREREVESCNATRFLDMIERGVEPCHVATSAFAQYLEEIYTPKERGEHNMKTDCVKFPAWLFAKIGGAV